MKKEKKGFIFIETIVVLTLVALAMTITLATYSLVTSRSKIKMYYNLSSDIYLLHNISRIGTDSEVNYANMAKNNETFWIDKTNCSNTIGHIVGNCEALFTNNDIQNLGIIIDIDKEIRNNSSTKKYDPGTIDFLNTLKKYKDETKNKTIKYFVGRLSFLFRGGKGSVWKNAFERNAAADSIWGRNSIGVCLFL